MASEQPKVISITPTNVTIDTTYLRVAPSAIQPAYYTIQFKRAEDTRGEWQKLNETFSINDRRNVTINGLLKTTDYYARYILWTDKENSTDANVPEANFTTTCEGNFLIHHVQLSQQLCLL